MRTVVAENYLCFYAVLEMILSDIGIDMFSQYELANKFGIVLPKEYHIPNVHNVSFSENVHDQGAHIDAIRINEFFAENKINLKVSYIEENPYIDYSYDKYDNFSAEKKSYCVYTFSYGDLYHETRNYNVGHVALLRNCFPSDQIEIYDPGPRAAGIKIISRFAMHDAMEAIRGGVYIFEKC